MRSRSIFFTSTCSLFFLATGTPVTACGEDASYDTTQLIIDLQSDHFQTRENATARLKQRRLEAFPAVRQAVQSKDVEVSRRCLKILQFWLQSTDRAVAQAANSALKKLESSDDERVRLGAQYARRNAPENVIKRLEKLGVRFTYRQGKEVAGVDLSRQGVSNSDVASLHTFHEVESIDLDYTEVTSEVLSTFREFSQLRELRLRCGCLQDDHLDALQPLSNLEVLNLWRTGVSDAGLKSLGSLKNLKDLNLGHNHVTDKGLKHLGEMNELTTLNLIKTAITDRGLQRLAALPKLKHLNVKGTNVTLSGIQLLQHARPDLEIRYCPEKIESCDSCAERRSKPRTPIDSDTAVRLE